MHVELKLEVAHAHMAQSAGPGMIEASKQAGLLLTASQ